MLFRFVAPLPPLKQKAPLINKGPPASDDQTQIAVAFSHAALCNDSNGKIIQWYIIVSKTPEGKGIYRVLSYMLKMLMTYQYTWSINIHLNIIYFYLSLFIHFIDNLLVYYRDKISFVFFLISLQGSKDRLLQDDWENLQKMGRCIWKGRKYSIHSFRLVETPLWFRWEVQFINIIFIYYWELHVVLDKKKEY